jgi:type IV pilus assembly protein PilB
MTSDQLLQILKNEKILDEETAARLKQESSLSGKSVESILWERRIVDDSRVAGAKSKALKIPYRAVDFSTYDDSLLSIIPQETVRTYEVAPLSQKDNILVAGMVNPDDAKAQEALKFISKTKRLSLGVYIISYGDWQRILGRYSPLKGEIQKAVAAMHLDGGGESQHIVKLDAEGERSEDAPIIRIVADTLRQGVEEGASDIHIEPQESYLRVRFRVNGELREVSSLPLELGPAIISRVKIVSNLKIDENRIPQDGRFRSSISGRDIDFRVATFPTPLGEKVAIRILDSATGLKKFVDLGLTGRSLEVVKEGMAKPYGMILVTGPTGSGKTTTLYAMLQQLNHENVNILSLEDPVEYFVSGVNQSQVHPEIGYDFAAGLRQIVRQDPDVIMVGEIRDSETAALAVNASLTGHIVLSTLHTNNALGVIPRLIDMKVEPFLIPSALNIMLGQRLISVLCNACKKPSEPSAEIVRIIDEELKGLGDEVLASVKKPYQIWHAPGCDVCHGKGIIGRIAVYEVIRMTNELESIIMSGPTTQKIEGEARRQGMVSMRQDGIIKALAGVVPMEEVLSETESMD